MTTAEENLTIKEPLPKGIEDENIPTKIAGIDATAKGIKAEMTLAMVGWEEALSKLAYERETLIKRAKELAITQDDKYKIVEVPIYKKNRVDVSVLRSEFKDIYLKIKARINDGLYKKYQTELLKYEDFIPQDEVKSETKDKAILAKVIPPNTEIEGYNYSVAER